MLLLAALLSFSSAWAASGDVSSRPMSTDRPDKTESPYSVPMGRFQAETDLVSYIRDVSGGTTTELIGLNVMNLKMGVSRQSDLQLIVPSWVVGLQRESGGMAQRTSGVGDLTARAKLNLLGNDGGDWALGLLGAVTVPVYSEVSIGTWIASLSVPVLYRLPGDCGWELGGMFVLGMGREFFAQGTWVATFPVTGALAAYTEFFVSTPLPLLGGWVVTFDVGMTYLLTPEVQLDAGANMGVTEAAPDLNPFLGLSFRI